MSDGIHDITKENLSQVPASRGSNKIEFIVECLWDVTALSLDVLVIVSSHLSDLLLPLVLINSEEHFESRRCYLVFDTLDIAHAGSTYDAPDELRGVCYSDTSVKEASGDSDQWYFTTETQESLVWLVAKLMKEYGIGIDHVIRHYDVTGKICPNPYVKNNKTRTSWTWDEFLARVKQQAGEPSSDEKQSESVTTKYYRVRKSWAEKASQIGAFTVFQNAKNCVDANPGYAAFDDNGNQVYPEAGECRNPL